jgi:uncharacterized membrane protein YecN with MAPEG domain
VISAIYASLSALLTAWLSLAVIRVRRREKISIGDGNNKDARVAIAAQLNAVEYIPITLLLLFSAESNHAPGWLIHVVGISVITGRLVHAHAPRSGNLGRRVIGMQVTILTIIGLSVTNLCYVPYPHVFRL